MRRAAHLLIMLAVLCCGLHLGEPAEAMPYLTDVQQCTDTGGASKDCDKHGEGSADHANAGHSHCPVAPDQRTATGAGMMVSSKAILFACRVVALHSVSQAPPIEPPTA